MKGKLSNGRKDLPIMYLIHSTNKNQYDLKNEQRIWIFSKKHTDRQQVHEKVLSITKHHENANQNHNDNHLTPVRRLLSTIRRLSWASYNRAKGHQFKFGQIQIHLGHVPGLCAWSPAEVCARGNQSVFLSHISVSLLSFSLPSPLSK